LNSDTQVRPGAIKSLVSAAEAKPGAGLVSPRLLWPDETVQQNCFVFQSPLTEFSDAVQTRLIDDMLRALGIFPQIHAVIANPEWTSFACVLIKSEVFEEIGLLDEKYFMYYEDVEFCHRASKAGWDIINITDAHVVHFESGSSAKKEKVQKKSWLPMYFYESRALYFYQTHGWAGLTMANLLWGIGRLFSKIRQLLGRSDKAAIEYQWWDIWSNWLIPLKPYTHPDADN
jgi:N-acetylglucosaminyl-diphospho-decaprenol L-rhamnosyltransferase